MFEVCGSEEFASGCLSSWVYFPWFCSGAVSQFCRSGGITAVKLGAQAYSLLVPKLQYIQPFQMEVLLITSPDITHHHDSSALAYYEYKLPSCQGGLYFVTEECCWLEENGLSKVDLFLISLIPEDSSAGRRDCLSTSALGRAPGAVCCCKSILPELLLCHAQDISSVILQGSFSLLCLSQNV